MYVTSVRQPKRLGALAMALLLGAPVVSAADVDISGFLSVGGGFVDDSDYNGANPYGQYREEDLTFSQNLLGLQVTGQVSERITATAQMIARSGADYSVNTEWAYLSWQVDDISQIRAGRLRTPLYMYSDFLDVAYSYHWISAPQEVYYIPFHNVDGIDYYLTAPVGSFDVGFQAYFGSYDDEFALGTIAGSAKTRNQVGAAATLSRDWWSLRLALHQAKVSIAMDDFDLAPGLTLMGFLGSLQGTPYESLVDRIVAEDDTTTFGEIGFNIDTGRYVAAAEYVEFKVDDSFLAVNKRSYVMGGVRVGSVLLHVTASQGRDSLSDPAKDMRDGLSPNILAVVDGLSAHHQSRRDVMSYGARWDVNPGIALKLQLDDVDDKKTGKQQVVSVAAQAVF